MAEWLTADVPLFDVHLRVWMLFFCVAGHIAIQKKGR